MEYLLINVLHSLNYQNNVQPFLIDSVTNIYFSTVILNGNLPSSEGYTSESISSWTWSEGESPTSLTKKKWYQLKRNFGNTIKCYQHITSNANGFDVAAYNVQ